MLSFINSDTDFGVTVAPFPDLIILLAVLAGWFSLVDSSELVPNLVGVCRLSLFDDPDWGGEMEGDTRGGVVDLWFCGDLLLEEGEI